MEIEDIFHICHCAKISKTARGAVAFYSDALKPASLTISQFTLMAAIYNHGGLSFTDLAHLLSMERSSLTRKIAPLVKRQLVERIYCFDARMRMYQLTQKGEDLMWQAYPLWQEAQESYINPSPPY